MTLICLWIIVHFVSGKLLAGEHPGFLRLPLASPIQAVIIFIFHMSGLSLRNVARAGIPLWAVGASSTGKLQQLCSEMQILPWLPISQPGPGCGAGFHSAGAEWEDAVIALLDELCFLFLFFMLFSIYL